MAEDTQQTIYLTRTGRIYHVSNECIRLKSTATYSVPLEYARRKHLRVCRACKDFYTPGPHRRRIEQAWENVRKAEDVLLLAPKSTDAAQQLAALRAIAEFEERDWQESGYA